MQRRPEIDNPSTRRDPRLFTVLDLLLTLLAQQDVLLLALLLGVGAAVGRVRVAGVSIGAAGVLLLAIALGAWADARGHKLAVAEPLGQFGLALFTYAIGVLSGPGFFATLRRGVGPNLAMLAVLVGAALLAVGLGRLMGLDPRLVAGSFAGALTNTPALAAAREASGHSPLPTVGYAVTYVFGVLGMLLACGLALRHRQQDQDQPAPLVNCSLHVLTAHRPRIRDIEQRHQGQVRFSRLRHPGQGAAVTAPQDDDVLAPGDLVTVVGPADQVEAVTHELGQRSDQALDADRSALDFRRITLSNEQLAGHTIGDLGLMRRFGATVTRVRRGDVDRLASDDLVLQPGDRLRLIAPRQKIAAVSAWFGDSERGQSDINPLALGLGLLLGMLLGRLALPLPGGGHLAIGSAAGTLLVGLVAGRVCRVGPVVTSMSHVAALALSELGLLVFLAQAGVKAGGQLGVAFASGAWLPILLLGVAITSFVSVGIYLVMRHAFGMGCTRLSGVLAGTQTQPAVLAFANGRTGHDARVAQGYALVYPAAMVGKILLGQWLGHL
jgi:putative transport protein